MRRILLVEDSPEFSDAIYQLLGSKYEVKVALSLREAHLLLAGSHFDLILLDLQLPDGNGFELCTYVRSHETLRSIPLLIISGRNDASSRVIGLDLGADDYLVKPFSPEELGARVRARLRIQTDVKQKSFSRGPFLVDINMQRVFIFKDDKKRDLNLTPVEYRVLAYLIEGGQGPLTREQLIANCFRGEKITSRALDVHIHSIRKKLGTDTAYIKTIYGSGYAVHLD